MVTFKCDITIGKWRFGYCIDLEMVSDMNAFTGTCRITLPRKYMWQEKAILLNEEPSIKQKDKNGGPSIKRMDRVVVKLGYDNNQKTEFVGYVKEVKAKPADQANDGKSTGSSLTIECEDSMLLLKQNIIKDRRTQKTAFSTPAGLSLEEWLKIMLPKDIKPQANKMTMGGWRIKNQKPAEVLDLLKKKYGLYSYFRLNEDNEPVLYVGFPYSQLINERRTVKYTFAKTIVDAKNLVYREEKDVKVKVKATSTMPDNKTKKIELGDAGGELITLSYYDMDEKTLEQRATEEMIRRKYTGYRGSFKAFGAPSIKIGDIAHLVDNPDYPDGKYLVGKVTKNVSLKGGYKQTIEPQRIVNDN